METKQGQARVVLAENDVDLDEEKKKICSRCRSQSRWEKMMGGWICWLVGRVARPVGRLLDGVLKVDGGQRAGNQKTTGSKAKNMNGERRMRRKLVRRFEEDERGEGQVLE